MPRARSNAGDGGVIFKIRIGDGGTTIIQGFDSASRDGGMIRGDTASLTGNIPAAAQGTVIAGSTYFDLDGTKIIFEGSTRLSYASGIFTGS